MIRYLTLLITIFAPFVIIAQQTNFDWAAKCGNPPNTTDTKTCMASGPEGTFVMAGEFLNEAKFGDVILNSAGGTDVFVVEYSPEGDVISAFQTGAADYDFVQDVAMDEAGNIFVLGYFYGTTQVGSDSYTSYGSQDIFIAMIDGSGKVSWSDRIGGIMADYPSGITLDEDGNVIVAGYFYNEMMIGDTSLVSTAGSDIFLAKFGPDGTLMDMLQAGGSSSDQVRSVAVDTDGHIILAGSFYSDLTIGDTTLATSDPVGVFVAKVNPALGLEWAFQLDGSYLTTEIYAEADHQGNLYIGGNFSEDIHFGDQTFSAGEFNQDVYLAKYNRAGNLLWARHGHGWGSDQVTGLGVDENNNVYMTGHYLDTIHFDDITLPYTLCCGSREVFIINYTHGGSAWWGDQVSGARASLHSMTMNSSNQLMMSGLFTEEVILGPWTLSYFEGFRNWVACLSGDIFTGIATGPSRMDMKVFPNPVRETVFFNSPEKITRLEVYDAIGSVRFTREGKDITGIDVSGLAPGTYFLRIMTESGEIGVERVVVLR